MDEIKTKPIGPLFEGMIWPIHAKNIEDAKRIWREQGYTNLRRMTKEEVMAAFPRKSNS